MQEWIEKETATAKFGTMKAATVKARKAKTGKAIKKLPTLKHIAEAHA